MPPVVIQIQRLPEGEGLPLPAYMSEHAAGMDLQCADEQVTLLPGGSALISTGFAIAVPKGYEGQIRPRSGLALKHGLTIPNAPGTIDADYRGPVKVILRNMGPDPVTVSRGDRIAQLVIAPVARAEWTVVDELPPTDRGEGGFGHTGM